MNEKERIYTDWKTSRSKVELPDGFSERVMTKVVKQEQVKASKSGSSTFRSLFEMAVRILMGIGLSALGILRVACLVGGLMRP